MEWNLAYAMCLFSVTSTYMFPYKEDLFRFDFEVDAEDESICQFLPAGGKLLQTLITPSGERDDKSDAV